MKCIYLSLLLSLISLLSCTNKKSTNSKELAPLKQSEVFSKKKILYGKTLTEPFWGDMSVSINASQYGILAVQHIDNYVIQLLDFQSGKSIVNTEKLGRGPEEFIFPSKFSYDCISSTLYVGDLMKREIYSYSVLENSIVKKNDFIWNFPDLPDNNRIYLLRNFARLTDSTFVFSTRYPDELKIIDLKDSLYFSMPIRTIDKEGFDYDNKYFDVTIMISRDRKKAVLYDKNLLTISVYEVKNNSLSLFAKRNILEAEISYSSKWFILGENHIDFPSYGLITSDYIYILAHNRTEKEALSEGMDYKQRDTYLLVFDMNCNLVAQYYMDKKFTKYTVSYDDRTLYALDSEMQIIRYELPFSKKK